MGHTDQGIQLGGGKVCSHLPEGPVHLLLHCIMKQAVEAQELHSSLCFFAEQPSAVPIHRTPPFIQVRLQG